MLDCVLPTRGLCHSAEAGVMTRNTRRMTGLHMLKGRGRTRTIEEGEKGKRGKREEKRRKKKNREGGTKDMNVRDLGMMQNITLQVTAGLLCLY